jgi:cyclophilin family peptidyl-prolyl cis-trans isomerase/HEAT repeat protein
MQIRLQSIAPASLLLVFALITCDSAQTTTTRRAVRTARVPTPILLKIVRAEDERRWDNDLLELMSDARPAVRQRAALAAGRIGNDVALPAMSKLLNQDPDDDVRAMAAFAIGEIESESGADVLLAIVTETRGSEAVRARAIEALGKIAAVLTKGQEARQQELSAAVIGALKFESRRASAPDRQVVLLGLTAALRSRAVNAGATIAQFLTDSNPRVRADAANTLARLRLKDGNEQLRNLLTTDPDPVVRANAARALGATEDKTSLDALVDSMLSDKDPRTRLSAIRALAALKESRAAEVLLKRGTLLMQNDLSKNPVEVNEALEIATAIGRLLQGKPDQPALIWLGKLRKALGNTAPEVELSLARISPDAYLAQLGNGDSATLKVQETILLNWRAASAMAQGLGELAGLPESVKNRSALTKTAEELLRSMSDYRNSRIKINTLVAVHSEYAIPDVLRALAAFKPNDLADLLLVQLNETDVIVRGTAADLLGDISPSDAIARALIQALPRALNDELNDAALSILDSLAKQKSAAANEAIKTALASTDYLIRRRAVSLLEANGAGDFTDRIRTVQTRNTAADYQRALSRIGKSLRAVVTTTKGSFTMELLPSDAPLTVDNFVQLANRGYFRGITIHRVVPNFVIQDGDPRGDGNGGPGYQIRCEINEIPFDRAAVGMALSGKDTGGSQWFVTHSPQPHLDGGYTVFGRVIAGMEVVDSIVRGDVIQAIVIK